MEYRGYTIQISVFPDSKWKTYHATYTVLRENGTAETATVPGGINSIADAERIAGLLARWSIDERLVQRFKST